MHVMCLVITHIPLRSHTTSLSRYGMHHVDNAMLSILVTIQQGPNLFGQRWTDQRPAVSP